MTSVEVYYFSGTGNSLSVARMLAQRLGGAAIPMVSRIDRQFIESEATVIGITFPVYYTNLPNSVRRFAERLDAPPSAYVFGVATYGGAAGWTLESLDEILRSRGRSLSAGFGVHMPQNAFRKPWERVDVIVRQAAKRCDVVARSVEARRGGLHYTNLPMQWILSPFRDTFVRATAKSLEKLAGVTSSSGRSVEELIPLADAAFAVDDRCNGCGLCVRVCPVNNIVIADGRPSWQHRCENCLACTNWCPQEAIHGGIAHNEHRYRHRDVTAQDIAQQSEPSPSIDDGSERNL